MKRFAFAAAAALIVTTAGTAVAQTVVITPEQQPVIQQYVVKQQVAPVQLPSDFDLIVGATLPSTVELHTIDVPDIQTQYEYVVVGQQTVLVDPQTRQVVQIIE